MTRLATWSAILIPVWILANSAARADIYDLDPMHTEVRFSWDHLGMSRQAGRFTDIKGTLTFDPGKPEVSVVDISIPIKSISTGVKKLDEHLLTSKEFFDPATHPAITFKSTGVVMNGGKTAQVAGDLSINGVAKPVVLDVTWNFTGEHPLATINPTYAGAFSSGFSATTQIRRSDWGLTRTIPYVSDELKITIETELIRREVTAPAVLEGEHAGALPPEGPSDLPAEGLSKDFDPIEPPASDAPGGLGSEKIDDGR